METFCHPMEATTNPHVRQQTLKASDKKSPATHLMWIDSIKWRWLEDQQSLYGVTQFVEMSLYRLWGGFTDILISTQVMKQQRLTSEKDEGFPPQINSICKNELNQFNNSLFFFVYSLH